MPHRSLTYLTRVMILDEDTGEIVTANCMLGEAIEDEDEQADVLAEIRRDGFAIVGGGAAPPFRITVPAVLS